MQQKNEEGRMIQMSASNEQKLPESLCAIFDLHRKLFNDDEASLSFGYDVVSGIYKAYQQQGKEVDIENVLRHAQTQCQEIEIGADVDSEVRSAIKAIKTHDCRHYDLMMARPLMVIGIVAQGGMYRLYKPNEKLESLAPIDGGKWVPLGRLLENISLAHKSANSQQTHLSRLDVGHFNSHSWFTKLRLGFWGMVLRGVFMTGHPVVLIGAARSGKTLLLTKMGIEKLDIKPYRNSRDPRPAVPDVSTTSSGIIAVDDCQDVDPPSLHRAVMTMAAKNRPFCLAAQRFIEVRDAVDAYRSAPGAKRIFVVVVGGDANPKAVLRELPQ